MSLLERYLAAEAHSIASRSVLLGNDTVSRPGVPIELCARSCVQSLGAAFGCSWGYIRKVCHMNNAIHVALNVYAGETYDQSVRSYQN
jgi:hypothetical protein